MTEGSYKNRMMLTALQTIPCFAFGLLLLYIADAFILGVVPVDRNIFLWR